MALTLVQCYATPTSIVIPYSEPPNAAEAGAIRNFALESPPGTPIPLTGRSAPPGLKCSFDVTTPATIITAPTPFLTPGNPFSVTVSNVRGRGQGAAAIAPPNNVSVGVCDGGQWSALATLKENFDKQMGAVATAIAQVGKDVAGAVATPAASEGGTLQVLTRDYAYTAAQEPSGPGTLPLEQVEVTIAKSDNSYTNTQLTDVGGAALWSGLSPGSYLVTVATPPGYSPPTALYVSVAGGALTSQNVTTDIDVQEAKETRCEVGFAPDPLPPIDGQARKRAAMSEKAILQGCFLEITTKFTELKDSLLPKSNQALPEQLGWFEHKLNAAIRVAERGQVEPTKGIFDEIVSLFKESHAAFIQLKGPRGQNAYVGSESLFNELGDLLNALCLDLDAGDGGSSRVRFRQVAFAGRQMEEDAGVVRRMLSQWWRYFQPDALAPFRATIGDLIGDTIQVKRESEAASSGCDVAAMRKSVEALCKNLTCLQERYHAAVCELERLECRPELEPPFLKDARTVLDWVAASAADALRALKAIRPKDESRAQQLKKEWKAIHKQGTLVRDEITRWKECQLCAPPDFCQATTARLIGYAEEALKEVDALPCDFSGSESSGRLCGLIDSLDKDVLQFVCQVDSLPGFRKDVLDPCWGHIVRIRHLLCPCPKVEETCTSPEMLLTRFCQIWTKRAETAGECKEDTVCEPARKPTAWQKGAPAPVSAAAVSVPEVRARWESAIAEARIRKSRLESQIPEDLRAQEPTLVALRELIALAETERDWLKRPDVIRRVPSQQIQERSAAQWTRFKLGMEALLATIQVQDINVEESLLKALRDVATSQIRAATDVEKSLAKATADVEDSLLRAAADAERSLVRKAVDEEKSQLKSASEQLEELDRRMRAALGISWRSDDIAPANAGGRS